jgi:hypothetical protein
VLAPTAKFAWPEAVAADVSVPPVAAYSTLGVTAMARAEAATADVTESLSQLQHLPIFLQQRQQLLISLSLSIPWQEQRQRPLMSLLQLQHLPIFLQQRQRPLISLSLTIVRQEQRQRPLMSLPQLRHLPIFYSRGSGC